MNDIVLECRNVHHAFKDGDNQIHVLNGINFKIQKGESVAIIGSSGAGKSTLLQILGGLDTPTSGEVNLVGHNLGQKNGNKRGLLRNKYLGFVYQFHHLLPEFSALENVAMPLFIAKLGKTKAKEAAKGFLSKVGLEHRLDHRPAQLSGGERQRAAIARAIATNPACLLADEPTGNLDEETANKILELLLNLNKEFDNSLIIVTHDLKLAKKMDKIYELKNGKLELI